MPIVSKYLEQYAEPEINDLIEFQGIYKKCLVIPSYHEDTNTHWRFINFVTQQGNTLLILIANRPNTDDDIEWFEALLNSLPDPSWENNSLRQYLLANNSSLLLVDRCSTGNAIDEKYGVGQARKIGNDIACKLITIDCLQSHWIANCDADCLLPSDYFNAIDHYKNHIEASAILFPFQHIATNNSEVNQATKIYQLSLQYYVSGLTWAGSPYAYHSLGSTIVINYVHYTKVRGFPKRSGGEDFYLLNKLLKTDPIFQLERPCIDIESRLSARVPFGTGPAIAIICQLNDPFDYQIYHPMCFYYLKHFLSILHGAVIKDELIPIETLITSFATEHLSADILLSATKALDVNAGLAHAFKQGKDPQQRQKQIDDWFDAFKTLKFIHHLRDNGLGEVSIKTLISDNKQFEFIKDQKLVVALDHFQQG